MAGKGNPNWRKGGPSPNPTGRAQARRTDGVATPPVNVMSALARAGVVTMRADGYVNTVTGLGQSGRDKSVGTVFEPDIIDTQTAENIYRGDPIGARMVDLLPDEATCEMPEICVGDHESPDYYEPPDPATPGGRAPRAARQVDRRDAHRRPPSSWERRVVAAVGHQRRRADAADSKSISEEIEHKLGPRGLNAIETIRTMLKFRRAYGGGAVFIGANDYTTDLTAPLDLTRVRSLDYLWPLEARELQPVYWYNDPFDSGGKFRKPAIYQLTPFTRGTAPDGRLNTTSVRIHESRLLISCPPTVSTRQLGGVLDGWGDNVYTRTFRALKSYASSIQNIDVLLSDFAQAIYKVKGLAAALLQNPNALTDALMGVELCRSIARAVIIDEGEEFERKSTALSGYPEMIDRLSLNVAAAFGIPMTRLFGQSPGGLNSTGQSDDRFYFGQASTVQTHEVAPAMLRLVEIELAIRGENPDALTHSVAFKPLWQPTELETAQARLAVAQADKIYIESLVVSAEEVALSRYGGDSWSGETHLDFEARAAQMAVLPPAVDANPEPDPVAEDPNDPSANLDHSDPDVPHGDGWVWYEFHEDKFNPSQPRGPDGRWIKTGSSRGSKSAGGGSGSGGGGSSGGAAPAGKSGATTSKKTTKAVVAEKKATAPKSKTAGSATGAAPAGKDAQPITGKEWQAQGRSLQKKLTADEQMATREYTGHNYVDINASLRGFQNMVGPGWSPSRQEAAVKGIDSALAKARAPKTMLVYRGAKDRGDGPFLKLQPGDRFHDPAFLSTSYSKSKAFKGNVEMHITVPRRTRAGVVPSTYNEGEILLGRGATLHVTRREALKGGRIRLHATVVSTDPP